jgi:uncharacterized repeat protein (TIGR03803 family)
MKNIKLILTVLIALIVNASSAQTQLWGTCQFGGTNNKGTIFKCDGNGNNFVNVYSMDSATGSLPIGSLCLATNNKLYGVTTNSGSCQIGGVCYSYDPATGIFDGFHDFACDPIHGLGAGNAMVVGIDGNLYGLAPYGGVYSGGVIYKVDPNTNSYSDIYDFKNTTGSAPYCTLLPLNNGKLYGVTERGGSEEGGVIFSFDPSTSTFNMLHSFDSTTGIQPFNSGLIMATDGKLYGVTEWGGLHGWGVIFSFDTATNIYTDLFDFTGSTGSSPWGSLIQATDGKLYGITSGSFSGYVVIFNYDISTNTYTDLLTLNVIYAPDSPEDGFIQASNGKLFGLADYGGSHINGVAFSYDISANTYTVLENFDTAVGNNPRSGLIETLAGLGIPSINIKEEINTFPNPATNTITFHQSNLNSQPSILNLL